jgi:very-short-patch-repair endonuclease
VGVLSVPTGIEPVTIVRARRLRRSMTEGERKLWRELREFRRIYGVHVRKQAPIGPYITDFAIHEKMIVIEVDGEHHFMPEQAEKDIKRNKWLAGQGYKVIRFTTGDLTDSFDGCIEEVLREIGLV